MAIRIILKILLLIFFYNFLSMLPANLYLFAEMDVMMHRNTWYVESKHIFIVKQRFFNHKLRLSTSSYLTVQLCFKNGC